VRYDAELEEPEDALPGTPAKKPKTNSIELMRQLITEHSAPANFGKFHDHYHEALCELVGQAGPSKAAHAQIGQAKVVNFMDALKKSLHSRAHAAPTAHRRRRSA
jgi:non-homologous end joining protein Ku